MFFDAVLPIILPVFAIIAVGYLAATTGYLNQSVGDGLGRFVVAVAIPLLLFRTLAQAELPASPPWNLWLAYFGGITVSWILSTLAVFMIEGKDGHLGVIAGVSGGYSNLVLIGIPLTALGFGDQGLVVMLLIVAVHLPIMTLVSTLLFELAPQTGMTSSRGQRLREGLVRGIAKNPLILGSITGLLWRFTGVPLSGPVDLVIDSIGSTAVPCALITIGMVLRKYGITHSFGTASLIAVSKLLIMPLAVWFFCTQFTDLSPLWIAVAVIGAGMPTGINAYLFANHFNTGHALASSTITITTLSSVFTLSGLLIFFGV